MSQIAGFYNPKSNFSENPKRNFVILEHMIKNLQAKTNDQSGYSIIEACCLAQTISDYSESENKAPTKLIYQNQFYHIALNGEIYNIASLKEKLASFGYDVSKSTVSEIAGFAFIHYGPRFVEHLNGVFSIAIYDETQHTLYLYRDRFGVKPFYYTFLDKTIVFSSRIDTLFEYPRVKPRLDLNGINEIFTLGPAKSYGFGVFSGIYELLPGEYLVYSPSNIQKNKYYSLKSVPHNDTLEDTIEHTKALLEDSIRIQSVSDLPVCSFLSGGIDSSIVTAIYNKYLPDNQSLCTYSFDYVDNSTHFISNSFQPSEDRPYVDIMKDYLGSDHTYLYCNYETLADLLTTSVDSRCLPTMADVDSSLIFFCSEVSKKHKVALTGECSDEIFGGYPWFHRTEMLQANTFPWMMDITFRKSLLNPEFAGALHMEQYIANSYEKSLSEVELLPSDSPLDSKKRQITYMNIKWFMQTLLDRMERAASLCGISARVPFADYRLVEYVYNTPWSMKSENGVPKSLLRAVAKPYLPEKIYNRPKSPYPKTYHPGYEKKLADQLMEILHDTASPLRSYLNIPLVKRFLKEPKEYGQPWFGQLLAGPQMIAYLIQIDYWMRKYNLSL